MISDSDQAGDFLARYKGLPGFDVEGALNRLDGDWEMFVEFVGEYQTEFSTFFDEFRSALETEDWETARRNAHSLKGAAGNIGAVNLQAAAKELEDACKERDVQQVRQQLASVEAAFAEMSQSAADLMTGEGMESPEASPAAEPMAAASLLALFRRLDTAMTTRDPVAADACLREISPQTVPDALREHLASLQSQVRDYGFEEARKTMDRMIQILDKA
jgi:HPt (histidine-containing phosphotransfer) domain-containing protein